jgi:Mrp family chromosome partitioning ATPase
MVLETAARDAVETAGIGEAAEAAWAALPVMAPSARTLARARITTRDRPRGSPTAFDILRTRILRTMRQNGWRTVAITSPTSESGKTTTCLNLAFSFGRRREGRTLAVECDLIRPAFARLLQLQPRRSIADGIAGRAPVDECLIRCGETLAIGAATRPETASAELLQSAACVQSLWRMAQGYEPDVMLFDLPPLFVSDDALGFAAHADCALIVAAEGRSRLDEVDRCIDELSRVTNVLGVVLSKSAFARNVGYGYYGEDA